MGEKIQKVERKEGRYFRGSISEAILCLQLVFFHTKLGKPYLYGAAFVRGVIVMLKQEITSLKIKSGKINVIFLSKPVSTEFRSVCQDHIKVSDSS